MGPGHAAASKLGEASGGIQYVQDMNLNTIRLEGKIESDEFFNLADEKGILIMAGWCCCDLWEEWIGGTETSWRLRGVGTTRARAFAPTQAC